MATSTVRDCCGRAPIELRTAACITPGMDAMDSDDDSDDNLARPARLPKTGDDLLAVVGRDTKEVAIPLGAPDAHTAAVRTHVCPVCQLSFVAARLLAMHEDEEHNPLFLARDDRRYRCIVEGCERDFSSPHMRRMHLRDKHAYPHDYPLRYGTATAARKRPTPQPDVPCRYERRARGSCRYGMSCAFSHAEAVLTAAGAAVPMRISFGRPKGQRKPRSRKKAGAMDISE